MAEAAPEGEDNAARGERSLASVGSTAKLMNRALRWSNVAKERERAKVQQPKARRGTLKAMAGAIGLGSQGFVRDDEWNVLESASDHIGSGTGDNWFKLRSRRSSAGLSRLSGVVKNDSRRSSRRNLDKDGKQPALFSADQRSSDKYVPRADAKVSTRWFTRRDKDGRTVLVQVEGGVVAKPKGGSNDSGEGKDERRNKWAKRFSWSGISERGSKSAASVGHGSRRMPGLSETSHAGGSGHGKDSSFHSKDPFHSILHAHSFYIHPHSMFMRIWDMTVVLISLWYSVVPPLRFAFADATVIPLSSEAAAANGGGGGGGGGGASSYLILELVASALLAFDLVLGFFTAFLDDDPDKGDEAESQRVFTSTAVNAHLVVNHERMRLRHLSTNFLPSLLMALPLDLILTATIGPMGWGSGSAGGGGGVGSNSSSSSSGSSFNSSSAPRLDPYSAANGLEFGWGENIAGAALTFGLLRVICIRNVWSYFNRWEWDSVDHTITDRCLRSFMVFAIGAHWLACGYIALARSAAQNGFPTFLANPYEQEFLLENGDYHSSRYVRALTWALTTVSGVGSYSGAPRSVHECLYDCFAVTLGTSFYLFTVGSITSLISSGDAVTAHTKVHLSALKTWMAHAGLPPEIRLRVLENFYAKHVTRKGHEDRSLLEALPRFLQYEVAMSMNKDIVVSTALFRGCSPVLVASMLEHLVPHRCLPLDSVVRKGDVGDELFLVKNGLFEVLNEDRTVHRMLGAGSYFGEIALLCQVHRTMTVRAVSHALVFVIERQRFVPLMEQYPADFRQLLLCAAQRYNSKPRAAFLVGEEFARGAGAGGAERKKSAEWMPGRNAFPTLESMVKSAVQDGKQGRGPRLAAGALPSFTEGLGPRLAAGKHMIESLIDKSLHHSVHGYDDVSSQPPPPQERKTSSSSSLSRLLASPLSLWSTPLAFMQAPTERASLSDIKREQMLTSIPPTVAEERSRLQDREILARLLDKSNAAPRRASFEVDERQALCAAVQDRCGNGNGKRVGFSAMGGAALDDDDEEEENASGSQGSRRRLSVHEVNRSVLEMALQKREPSEVEIRNSRPGLSPMEA